MTTMTTSERPVVHFTPSRNWMNDPNGLIHHGGRWHLFFQHNPEGIDWGDMSWGHASSVDLREWIEHPVALRHDDDEAVFSGSVVFDAENTSGLGLPGLPPLVAIYTSARPGSQAQALASSTDGGETWTKHGVVLDRGTADFRDPKVFRHGDHWVMVAVEALDRQAHLFRSDDLRSWTPLSVFGPAGSTEGIWECPDLFPLGGRWVLLISTNPGNPAGGSGMQQFIGDFDGTVFAATSCGPFDHGRDLYAGVTVTDAPEPTLIGWMGNWDYADVVPTSPWRGSMALPRRLALRGEAVLQLPALPDPGPPVWLAAAGEVPSGVLPPAAHGRALRVRLRCTPSEGAVALTIRAAADGSRGTTIRIDGDILTVDRRASGNVDFSPSFPSVSSARVPADAGGSVSLEIWIDASSVEVFADEGAVVLTEQIFPSDEDIAVTLEAPTGGSTSIDVTDLRA